MTVEDIKQRIHQLRKLRAYNETEANLEMILFRDELHEVGLTVFWSSEDNDYAIYLNETTEIES